jgi:hypothetical protein
MPVPSIPPCSLPLIGAAVQTKATQLTNTAASQLLDYAETHPDAVVHFCSSPMILSVHSDASYLSEAKARSRAGGLFYLSTPPASLAPGATAPALNGCAGMRNDAQPCATMRSHVQQCSKLRNDAQAMRR